MGGVEVRWCNRQAISLKCLPNTYSRRKIRPERADQLAQVFVCLFVLHLYSVERSFQPKGWMDVAVYAFSLCVAMGDQRGKTWKAKSYMYTWNTVNQIPSVYHNDTSSYVDPVLKIIQTNNLFFPNFSKGASKLKRK